MKKHGLFLLVFVSLCSLNSYGQFKSLQDQLPQKKKWTPDEVIDSLNGITIYEKLNKLLSGDSVRNCLNYACDGWREDFYTTGELLHRGFYEEGQLKTYENYYPNGELERSFKMNSVNKGELYTYHNNGQPKETKTFINQTAVTWAEYNKEGKMIYERQYDPKKKLIILEKEFDKNGTRKMSMDVNSKKDKTYIKRIYHENGALKCEGMVVLISETQSYNRTGKWVFFRDNGDFDKEVVF